MDDDRRNRRPVLCARRVGGSRHKETEKGRHRGRRFMPAHTATGSKRLYGDLQHGNGHSPVVPVRHGAGGTVPQMARPDGGVFQERAYGLVPASSAWGILLNGTGTV